MFQDDILRQDLMVVFPVKDNMARSYFLASPIVLLVASGTPLNISVAPCLNEIE